MRDLFPDDPLLRLFSQRFTNHGFDPTAVRPIISPDTQTRSKTLANDSTPTTRHRSPPGFLPHPNSPKRPLPLDDSDNDGARPRKLQRGASPLKGAAGRRLDQHKRNLQPLPSAPFDSHPLPPVASAPALPRDVLFLLSIIPRAETYNSTKFQPEAVVKMLREINLPTSTAQLGPAPNRAGMPSGSQVLPPPSPIPPSNATQLRPMPHMPHMSYPPNMPQMPNLGRPPMSQMASSHPPPHGPPMMLPQYPPASQGQYNNSRYPTFPPSSSGVSSFPHHPPGSVPNGHEPYGFHPPPFAGQHVGPAGSQHVHHHFAAGFP